MDIIFIHELPIQTIIGAYTWERQIQQTLILDLDMGFCIKSAAQTDDIAAALDYSSISEYLRNYLADKSFQLVETLAENVTQNLLREFPIDWIRLKVTKLGTVTHAKRVGVVIERSTLKED